MWPKVKALHHARVRTTPKTLANHKSNVRAALLWFANEAGVPKVGVRLTAEWAGLRSGMPDQHRRKVLYAPFRYWSAQGLVPADITEAALDGYMRYRAETTRLAANDAARRKIARAWNAGVGTIDGWPAIRLMEPPCKVLTTPAWDEFPERLRQEIETYLAGLTKIWRGANGKRIRPCKPVTIRTRLAELQAFARMAVRLGVDPTKLTSLSALLDPDLVEKVLDAYWNKDEEAPRIYVVSLAWKLLSVVRETKCLGEDGLERLDELRATLAFNHKGGMTDKNLELIRQVLTDDVWDEVINLPTDMMKQSHLRRDQSQIKAAVIAQLATAIAILCVAPVRLKNLASIKLGQNLIKPGGSHSPNWLVFPDYDVKNRVKLEFPLDEELSALIDEYLHQFRPTLMRGHREEWLFPGLSGGTKTRRTLSLQVTQRIQRATGLRITVHQFRHAAGAIYLRQHPGDYVTVQLLLGHISVQTTTKFYIGLSSLYASEMFGRIIRSRINRDRDNEDPRYRDN